MDLLQFFLNQLILINAENYTNAPIKRASLEFDVISFFSINYDSDCLLSVVFLKPHWKYCHDTEIQHFFWLDLQARPTVF